MKKQIADPPPQGEQDHATAVATHAGELSRLFEEHNDHLVSFLADRLGSQVEAKEVAQEAYVRVLQLDRPGVVSFLRAYLYKTASNIAVDRLRHRSLSQKLELPCDPDQLADELSPGRHVLAREELAIVQQALDELPAPYQRALLLSRVDHRTTAEIGSELGCKGTQARLYLRRAVAYCTLRLEGLGAAEARERVFR